MTRSRKYPLGFLTLNPTELITAEPLLATIAFTWPVTSVAAFPVPRVALTTCTDSLANVSVVKRHSVMSQ